MPNAFEKIATKGAGKVAAVQAMTKGLKGVFVTLAEQHQEASVLLSRAIAATDTEKRLDLWEEIKEQLVSHERAELKTVYPALAADPRTQGIVRTHAAEAGELEKTINQIDKMGVEGAGWKAAIEHLAALVKSHATEEEREFFPRAQEVLGEEGCQNLEKPFMRAKEREMGGDH